MKNRKRLLKFFMIIILIVIVPIGCDKLSINYTNKYISPNKTNVIKIEAKEPAGFLLFGPSDIKIYFRKNKFLSFMNKATIESSISNDGRRIDDGNFKIEWISEDIATITLMGEEQNPKVIKVNFNDTITINGE